MYILFTWTVNIHKCTKKKSLHCKVGGSFCFCYRKYIMSVTISVIRLSFFFFLLFSAEGPSPIVNKKISFNISCLSHLQVIEFDDGSGSVLRIQPLRTPRDEAIYECVASNSVGETSATTRLTVLRGRYSSTTSKERKKNKKKHAHNYH